MKERHLPEGLYAWSQPAHYGLTIRGHATRSTGKPLLHFLHGNGLCGLAYWPMLEMLQKDFDLLITDIQGHGESDAGERFLGWNTNADIATRVLRHHMHCTGDERPVYALAHSLGGALTTLMAGEHPDLFRKLVLLDPVYFPPAMITAMAGLHFAGLLDNFSPLSRQARRRRTHWPSRAAAENYLGNRGIFKGWDEMALKSFVRFALRETDCGRVELKCPPWIEAKIFASYPNKLWKTIRRLQVPTCLLMAEETLPFSSGSARRAMRMNPNYSSQTMAGTHCFMQEFPQQTASVVRTLFLDD